MTSAESLVFLITAIVAAAFLFLWMRRDKGADPR